MGFFWDVKYGSSWSLFIYVSRCVSRPERCVFARQRTKLRQYYFLLLASLLTVLQVRGVKKWSSRGLNVVSCGYKKRIINSFSFLCWFVLIFSFPLNSKPDRELLVRHLIVWFARWQVGNCRINHRQKRLEWLRRKTVVQKFSGKYFLNKNLFCEWKAPPKLTIKKTSF